MTKRLYFLAMLAGAAVLAAVAWGCGGSSDAKQNADNAQALLNQINNQDTGSLDQRIEDLKKVEMTVEMKSDGKSTGKWTQKNGSWRLDDATDSSSYTIYNKEKNKLWQVDGSTATEMNGSQESTYAAIYNPAVIISAFSYMPKTGGTDDTWEFGIPGAGKLTIEFKGPQGLPTRMISEDSSGAKTTTEFNYSNVGSVPDSMFELPSDVKVTGLGSSTTGGFSPTAIPTIPDYNNGQ